MAILLWRKNLPIYMLANRLNKNTPDKGVFLSGYLLAKISLAISGIDSFIFLSIINRRKQRIFDILLFLLLRRSSDFNLDFKAG